MEIGVNMSRKNKKSLFGLTSQQLQSEFNDTCFKLGMEIHKEEVAAQNQVQLKEYQSEVSEAFNAAIVREQEAAANKAKADANTKAFEEKAAQQTQQAQAQAQADTTP
jgi:hypothetical protein